MYVHIMTQNKSYTKSKIGNLLAIILIERRLLCPLCGGAAGSGGTVLKRLPENLFVQIEIESPFTRPRSPSLTCDLAVCAWTDRGDAR